MSHVFLTGGSGVIGSALIPKLLGQPDLRLTVLLRAESHDHLGHRASRLLDFCGLSNPDDRERIQFLKGDVNQGQLGITTEDYTELQNTATAIIHSAGCVKLNQSIDDARRNAVFPAKEILSLARSARHLQKIDAVSTIGVAGRMPGVIQERRLTEPRTFHNNYEQAKSEAEEVLWQGIGDGLPITIHRPSMIVGDSRNGAIAHYQVFYHLCDFLSGRRSFGFQPDLGNSLLDIIPVDIVATAICLSVTGRVGPAHVLHLCSGSLPDLRLTHLAEKVRTIYDSHGKVCPKIRVVPSSLFNVLIGVAQRIGSRRLKKQASTLPYFLAYLGNQQRFDNTRFQQSLGEACMAMRTVGKYLPIVLGPYLSDSHAKIPSSAIAHECQIVAEAR